MTGLVLESKNKNRITSTNVISFLKNTRTINHKQKHQHTKSREPPPPPPKSNKHHAQTKTQRKWETRIYNIRLLESHER